MNNFLVMTKNILPQKNQKKRLKNKNSKVYKTQRLVC